MVDAGECRLAVRVIRGLGAASESDDDDNRDDICGDDGVWS